MRMAQHPKKDLIATYGSTPSMNQLKIYSLSSKQKLLDFVPFPQGDISAIQWLNDDFLVVVQGQQIEESEESLSTRGRSLSEEEEF